MNPIWVLLCAMINVYTNVLCTTERKEVEFITEMPHHYRGTYNPENKRDMGDSISEWISTSGRKTYNEKESSYKASQKDKLLYVSERVIPIEALTHSETPAENFKRLDKNNDGKMNFNEFLKRDKEYVKRMRKDFDAFDFDGDSKLDSEEYIELYKTKHRTELESVSTDTEQTDGEKSSEEELTDEDYLIIDSISESFKVYDADKTGGLNESELVSYLQEHLELMLLVPVSKIMNLFDIDNNNEIDEEEAYTMEHDMPERMVEYLEPSEKEKSFIDYETSAQLENEQLLLVKSHIDSSFEDNLDDYGTMDTSDVNIDDNSLLTSSEAFNSKRK